MSRQMDEIPDDVMKAAEKVAGDVYRAYHDDDASLGLGGPWEIVARAILAEQAAQRERDAKLIDDGVERQRGKIMRADGVHSKNDMCIHGRPEDPQPTHFMPYPKPPDAGSKP